MPCLHSIEIVLSVFLFQDRVKLGQNQVYFFSVVDGLSHDMKSLEILDRDALKAMSSHGVTEVSRKEGDRMPWLASWKGDFGLVLGSADLAIKFIRGPYFDQLQVLSMLFYVLHSG